MNTTAATTTTAYVGQSRKVHVLTAPAALGTIGGETLCKAESAGKVHKGIVSPTEAPASCPKCQKLAQG